MRARRKPGRGSQLSPSDRLEVQEMSLVQGLSNSQIARQTGRDRGTVATVLAAPDTVELKARLQTEQHEEALTMLRNGRVTAAGDWVSAITVAAKKGDHRPAKDLLLHTGTIQPVVADQGPRVAVQINLHGGPEPASLVAQASCQLTEGSLSDLGSATRATNESGPRSTPTSELVPEGYRGLRPSEPNDDPRLPRPIDTPKFSSGKSSLSQASLACGIALPVDGARDE